MSELLELPRIECKGSARELGRAQGEALREPIRRFIAGRENALDGYVKKRGVSAATGFVDAGRLCLAAAERWDPDGTLEHRGIAEGAGVDPALLYAIANLSDLRDVLLLGGAADGEGCSALLLPRKQSRSDSVIAAQTWDLGPADMEFVVAVHRKPASAPETWSVTCAGCLTLIGMNADGLAIGTTNIKARGSRPGVGYLSILHRIIRERSIDAAAAVVRSAPRAAAHTYWMAVSDSALELECGPEHCAERVLGGEPIVRTNHCLSPALAAIEGEAPTSSSKKRFERVRVLLGAQRHDVASLRALFADRADGIDSISRHPEDGQPTATNACVVCIPGERRIWACRGPSERGRWVALTFG